MDSVQVYRIQTVLLILIARYKDKHEQINENKKRTKEKQKKAKTNDVMLIDDRKRLRTSEGG